MEYNLWKESSNLAYKMHLKVCGVEPLPDKYKKVYDKVIDRTRRRAKKFLSSCFSE